MEIDEQWIEQNQRQLDLARRQYEQGQLDNMNQWYADQQNQDKVSLVKERLEVNDIYEMIEHYLRGDVLKADKNGNYKYVQPDQLELAVLTEYGIQLIMSIIKMYINKNTLMSNYDEKTINYKMLKFTKALNRTIFMEYEKIFIQPSLEECKRILDKKIQDKTDLRMYVNKLLDKNKETSKEEIRIEIIKEMEDFIEKEIDKIRQQTIVDKYKRYLIIMRSVQDAVHSTYLRALNGQERRSIGQTIHISENIGNQMPMQQKQGGFFGLWGTRKKNY